MGAGEETFVEELDRVHNPSDVEDTGRTNYPDGVYQVRLDKIFIDKAKSSGRVQCVMEFEIMVGALAFRKIWKYAGMMTSQNLDFLTRDLRALGVPPEFKWSELVTKYFGKLLDKTYEVELKTTNSPKDGKDYQNIWIKKEINMLIGDGAKKL